MTALELLAPFVDLGREWIYAAFAVFTRCAAMMSLLPGFGEMSLPPRIKLMAAFAFALIVWPAVIPMVALVDPTPAQLGLTLLAETVAGLLLGLSVRLMLFALQTAGSIAGQSTSLAQMFGDSITADMQPAFAHLLTLGGIVLAFALGLPAYAAAAMIESYQVIPFGTFPLGGDVAEWGLSRVATGFTVAVGLAAPFLVASFAYNVALGAINRAMPQLMVALVGAPAITGGALALMALAAPVILTVWGQQLLRVLTDPMLAP